MKKILVYAFLCIALDSCISKPKEESSVDSTEVTLDEDVEIDTLSVDSTSAFPEESEESQEEVFYCENHKPSHAAFSSQLASFTKEKGCTGFKSGK